ncbi:hypothetical protein KJ564_10000, partial [bacterium]|nr:hypothetical protein [bacterium]
YGNCEIAFPHGGRKHQPRNSTLSNCSTFMGVNIVLSPNTDKVNIDTNVVKYNLKDSDKQREIAKAIESEFDIEITDDELPFLETIRDFVRVCEGKLIERVKFGTHIWDQTFGKLRS